MLQELRTETRKSKGTCLNHATRSTRSVTSKRCSLASLLASLSLIELFIPRGGSSAIYPRFFLANSFSTYYSQSNSKTTYREKYKKLPLTATEAQPQPHSHSALVLAFHCPVILGRVGAKDHVQSERKALLSTPWAGRHPLKFLSALTPPVHPCRVTFWLWGITVVCSSRAAEWLATKCTTTRLCNVTCMAQYFGVKIFGPLK